MFLNAVKMSNWQSFILQFCVMLGKKSLNSIYQRVQSKNFHTNQSQEYKVKLLYLFHQQKILFECCETAESFTSVICRKKHSEPKQHFW